MKVVIVEDHQIMRDAIRTVCESELGFDVIAQTGSGIEAVSLIIAHRPDIVLLDLGLKDMDGFNVADRVLQELPWLKILILSSLCNDYTLFRVEKMGARGFVDKNSNTTQELRDALRVIATGETYFSQVFCDARAARRADPRSFTKILTDHERAILSLIGLGLSDNEIAKRLSISPNTARTHRHNILRKFDLKGTPKLIAFAVANGFTQFAANPSDRSPVICS